MSLQVQDNQYNSTIIQVAGEAYQEIVSLDISGTLQEMTQEDDERGKIRKETETNHLVGM